MESENLNTNIFENIYNNFLENSYLYILSFVKNSAVALDIIYKVVEQIFLYDYCVDNLVKIREKMVRYVRKFIKEYMASNSKMPLNEKYNLTIPKELYLFNFDLYKLFNDIDNKIIISMIVFDYEIKDIITLINFDEDYILEHYKNIIKQIRVVFFDKINPLFRK